VKFNLDQMHLLARVHVKLQRTCGKMQRLLGSL